MTDMRMIFNATGLVLTAICLLTFMTGVSKAQLSGSLTNGLVVHYEFSSNLSDSTQQVNHLTDPFGAFTSGYTSYGTDRFGGLSSMLNMLYSDVRLVSGNTVGITGNQPLTLSLWVKPSTDIGGIWLVGVGSLTNPMSAFALSFKETYPSPRIPAGISVVSYLPAGVGGTLGDAVSGDFGSTLSSWHHLVAVYSESFDGLSLYLNGIPLATSRASSSPQPSDLNLSDTSVFVGVQPNQDIAGNAQGSVDDIMVYDRALTSEEVSALYQAQSVPEPSTYALLLLSGAASLYALRRRKS